MDANELRKLIRKGERKFERRKLKRFVLTVLFYTAVLLVFCYWQGQLEGDIRHILSLLILCVIVAITSVIFNSVVFEQLLRLNKEEEQALEYLRKRLKEKEQENNS